MKLLSVVLLLLMASPATPALAETRTPPQATAHALDELANCYAQRRPECPTSTPTLSPTPTWTPSPTSTAPPTDTPTLEPIVLAPTPEPCWLTDQDGIVFDDQGAPVPCLTDTPTEEATAEPTDTPTPTPTATPRPTPQPAPAAPASAPEPQVQVVVQTVVVLVTAAPTDTPVPAPTPMLEEPTAVVRAVAILPAVPTSTSQPTATATVQPASPTAPSISAAHVTEPAPGRWEWAAFLGYLAAAIGTVVLLVAFVTRRRVAVWRGTPHA